MMETEEKSICFDCLCLSVCTKSNVRCHHCPQFKDQNRFVELPCKLGDTVYMIRECSCHVDGRWNNPEGRRKCSEKVYLGKKQRAYHCGYVTEAKFDLKHLADFGKMIFLTREEAEAALAERQASE